MRILLCQMQRIQGLNLRFFFLLKHICEYREIYGVDLCVFCRDYKIYGYQYTHKKEADSFSKFVEKLEN